MIRSLMILILLGSAHPAMAHVGHLGEVAGHAHWVAGAALGLAAAVAVWAGTRKSSGNEDRDSPDTDSAEPSEDEANA